MKFNGAKQRIFDAISCRIPLAKLTHSSFACRSFENYAHSRFSPPEAQHIHRRIQHMNADVDQPGHHHSSLLVGHPSRERRSDAGARAVVTKSLQNAVGHLFTRLLRIERKTMKVEVVDISTLPCLRAVSHISRAWNFSPVMAGGFFAHHMAARFQSAIRVCS